MKPFVLIFATLLFIGGLIAVICLHNIAPALHDTTSIADLLKLFLTTSAFVTALYTLFAKDTRLRAHAEHALISLVLFVIATVLMFGSYVVQVFSADDIYVTRSFSILSISLYLISFLSLAYFVFILAYNSLYNLRTDKVIKNFKPIKLFLSAFEQHKHYEFKSIDRKTIELAEASLVNSLSDDEKEILRKGCSILLTGRSRRTLIELSTKILSSRLKGGETVNFVSTDRPPIHIWDIWKKHDNDLANYRDDIVMIDAYSPTYGFGDDIQGENLRKLKKEEGVSTVSAKSYAGIHTATARAFNIIKNIEKKKKNSGKRRPMTMIYAFTSALCEVEGVEQFTVFWRHVLPSEASYNMLTILIEDDHVSDEVLRPLRQLCTFEFHVSKELGDNEKYKVERKG